LLGEDLAIPANVRIVHHCFFCRSVVKAHEISRERGTESAIWKELAPESSLVAYDACEALTRNHMYGDRLTRVVVRAVLIKDQVDEGVDSRDGLELDASEDRTFECFRKGLFNLLCTC
jgi:hypothetical protein